MTEAIHSSKASIFTSATCRNIPEDGILHVYFVHHARVSFCTLLFLTPLTFVYFCLLQFSLFAVVQRIIFTVLRNKCWTGLILFLCDS
jgi:hypothetical protein